MRLLFFVVLFGVFMWPVSGSAQDTNGELVVQSEPTGARVLVNGRAMGNTPLTLSLPGGKALTIEIERDGFEGISRSVEIVAGQSTTVAVTLVAASEEAAEPTPEGTPDEAPAPE